MVRLYWRRSSMSRSRSFFGDAAASAAPPFGTGQCVAPQLHLAVHLGKLLDTGIEHECVLDVAQKLRYLGHALALLHEGVGCGEAFLREPYDKGLFLNRGIDLFGRGYSCRRPVCRRWLSSSAAQSRLCRRLRGLRFQNRTAAHTRRGSRQGAA